jgi:hypothetical protein
MWRRARRALTPWLIVLAAIIVALAIVGLLALTSSPMYPAGR